MVHIIFLIFGYSGLTNQDDLMQHFLTACLLASFASDRTAQFVNKVYAFFLITIYAWRLKKHKRKATLAICILNFLFLPYILALCLVASLLSAPLLAVFTFPVFLFAFPRVKRFWPQRDDFFSFQNSWNLSNHRQNSKLDANFYAHLMPNMLDSFKELVIRGSLNGSYYVTRFQDRIVWIQVLESSHSYLVINVKGLELQETSCHTVEAQYMDDKFELAFGNCVGAQSNSVQLGLNRYLKMNPMMLDCMRPRDLMVYETYSDAKSSLVGVLDHSDNLIILTQNYLKVLHYFLIKHLVSQNIPNKDDSKSTSSITVGSELTSQDQDGSSNGQDESNFKSILSLPAEWCQLFDLFGSSDIRNDDSIYMTSLNTQFVERVLDSLDLGNNSNKQAILNEYEAFYWTIHHDFLLKSSELLGLADIQSSNLENRSNSLDINSIYKLYKGDLPWSPISQKLGENFPLLRSLLINSFRY